MWNKSGWIGGLGAGALLLLVVYHFSAGPVTATRLAAGPLTLPAGFVDELVVGGLLNPRAFVFASGGRIFIAEGGSEISSDINFASIRVFKEGALLDTRAITFNVCGDGERGFLGLALDPNFANNGYIYVYYTRQATSGSACQGSPGPRNRISRVTMVDDVIDPASERVLVDNIFATSGIHNAGDLHFGVDGYLYATTGDAGIVPSPAPDTNSLNGKILRILPTPGEAGGYTTTGNPFDTAPNAQLCGPTPPEAGSGPCREVFAYGLRNPFRFTIEPGTNNLFVGDVGSGHWEEIDQIVPGGNYGYPEREGFCQAGVYCSLPQPPSGFADPIYAYSHLVSGTPTDAAVIGGAFYHGDDYPAQYHHNYFFADFNRGFIRRLVFDNNSGTWSDPSPDFATGGDSIIGLRTGLDDNLYYLAFDFGPTSQIRRIRYSPGSNQPPLAKVSASPLNGPLSTVYTFSAAGSNDPDNKLPLTYNWNLGDGATLSSTAAQNITHQYNTVGSKTITLTVTDKGTPPLTSPPVTIKVFPGNTPPTATLVLTNVTAPGRQKYHAGDTWQFGVSNASDNQALPANPYNWAVIFHHREHSHPFLSGVTTPSGQFTIPTQGEIDSQVWYRVVLQITDAQGQTTTLNRIINPVTTTLTLLTYPPGREVVIDGSASPSPLSITRVTGLQVSLNAMSPQQLGDNVYTFSSWSNGGNKTQAISVPPGGGSYTAVFTWTVTGPNAIYMPVILKKQ